MKNVFYCEICGKQLSKDDLLVKILDSDNKFIRVVPVHIGDCDDKLCDQQGQMGNNTNGSFNLYSFKDEKDLNEYLHKGKRILTD